MQSGVVAFKSALLDRLQADGNLSGVQLSIGNPYPQAHESELIIIGDARIEPKQYTAGMAQANERFNLELLISVIGASQTAYETLLTRAYAIAEVIDDSVIAWAPLYGGNAQKVFVGEMSDGEAVTNDVREAYIEMTLEVLKRLS